MSRCSFTHRTLASSAQQRRDHLDCRSTTTITLTACIAFLKRDSTKSHSTPQHEPQEQSPLVQQGYGPCHAPLAELGTPATHPDRDLVLSLF
mmetsp:Transcript_22813/g.53888  ORF Transcript_22813/g.53888 Transcript_22813/m.53888 type:complete len:92 (-) Transcript_22813:963-1238(-)